MLPINVPSFLNEPAIDAILNVLLRIVWLLGYCQTQSGPGPDQAQPSTAGRSIPTDDELGDPIAPP